MSKFFSKLVDSANILEKIASKVYDYKNSLPIKIIILTVILDSVGIGIMIPVLPSLMTDVLPGKTVAEAAVWGGILASIFAVMQFIFGPILGSLSDAFGRRPVILISLIFMALDYIIMGLATSVGCFFLEESWEV